MVNIRELVTVTTDSKVYIGNRLCIVANTEKHIVDYYKPYKPKDKYECRQVYGNCKLSQSYWEAMSQGATDITCVAMPEVNDDTIQSLLNIFDDNAFDIVIINNLFATDYYHFKQLDDFALRLNHMGVGTLFVLACEPIKQTYSYYVSNLLNNYGKLSNPQYFVVTAGEVQYNTYSKFQYNTDSAATVGGLIASLPPYIDPVYKTFNGIKLVNEFTATDFGLLTEKGYSIITDTINKGKVLTKSYTYNGSDILTIPHIRVINSLSQYINRVGKSYYGTMLNMLALTTDIKYVIDWHKQNGYCKNIEYNVYRMSRDTVGVDLLITPIFSLYNIDVTLTINLSKS